MNTLPVGHLTATHRATFRDAFRDAEFRALFVASALSRLGDYMARAAITALVYQRTGSVAAAAATFAVSFAPWMLGGPVLAALAERLPYRGVMVLCDLIRMVLIAMVALPGLPLPAVLTLLFAVGLANPPAQAARSALLPLLLPGDRLVVGLSINQATSQVTQVLGFLSGAVLAVRHPSVAVLVDAGTFAASAAILGYALHRRPAATDPTRRRHLLRETAEGFRLIVGSPLRSTIALMVLAVVSAAIVPEGLAVAWASDLAHDSGRRGLVQGAIMAANPIGWVIGGLCVARLVPPPVRPRLAGILAVCAPLSLVPALLEPSAVAVVGMVTVCGFAVGGVFPTANALFAQSLPDGFRARAFGVMQSGIQITHAVAVLATGALADVFSLPIVVGCWSAGGVVLAAAASYRFRAGSDPATGERWSPCPPRAHSVRKQGSACDGTAASSPVVKAKPGGGEKNVRRDSDWY